MICCFDTSGINALHSDPDGQLLVTGLVQDNAMRVTSLNVIEVCGTKDVQLRLKLLKLLKQLGRGYAPLAPPNEILQRLASCQITGKIGAYVAAGPQAGPAYRRLLNGPEEIDQAELRQEVSRWKREL